MTTPTTKTWKMIQSKCNFTTLKNWSIKSIKLKSKKHRHNGGVMLPFKMTTEYYSCELFSISSQKMCTLCNFDFFFALKNNSIFLTLSMSLKLFFSLSLLPRSIITDSYFRHKCNDGKKYQIPVWKICISFALIT